jgi:two-component system, OmpR family, phosphate regulon sensor histidine kinase PhoR
MISRSKWFIHPIFIFVLSILALGTSLFLYIYWYIEASSGLRAMVNRFELDPQQVLASQTWVVILVLSILVGIILMGIFVIFSYNQKTLQLYRLQNNFINNFTHELKTPVTSLKLYLETFLKHELSPEDRSKYLRYMISDVDRLSDNINSILSIARIESKSYEGEFAPVEIVWVVRRFCEENRHHFEGCEVRIEAAEKDVYTCLIDLSLFEMLLMNLLTNAVHYNDADVPQVDISFTVRRRKLCIRFRDNGIGLERADTRKIFKKFYQVGRSDDMSAKGSGLGLFLVQSIAKIHRGRAIAESDGPGKGSVFTVILPLRQPAI